MGERINKRPDMLQTARVWDSCFWLAYEVDRPDIMISFRNVDKLITRIPTGGVRLKELNDSFLSAAGMFLQMNILDADMLMDLRLEQLRYCLYLIVKDVSSISLMRTLPDITIHIDQTQKKLTDITAVTYSRERAELARYARGEHHVTRFRMRRVLGALRLWKDAMLKRKHVEAKQRRDVIRMLARERVRLWVFYYGLPAEEQELKREWFRQCVQDLDWFEEGDRWKTYNPDVPCLHGKLDPEVPEDVD